MNNYCTNCGIELENKDLICSNCNTPIIDISNKNFTNYLLIIIFVFFLIFVFFKIISVAKFNYKIKFISKEYVEPYLNNYYDNYTYEYESSGKCIISGDCYFDPVMGCDGGTCEPYEYLDETECTSYYFEAKTSNGYFTITVYYKDEKYEVVKGNKINNKKDSKDKNFSEK